MVTEHISPKNKDELIVELQTRLDEAEQTLNAIQNGEIDAIITPQGSDGPKVYTLESADTVYRNLIEEMGEGVATLTNTGTIFYANAQLASMLQVPLDKIVGLKFNDFILSEDLGIYWAIFENGLETQTKGEINIKSLDGVILPVHISINTLKDLNGVYVVITDLSEQKHREELNESLIKLERSNAELVRVNQEFCESEERFRNLADNIPNLAWMADVKGWIFWYNKQWYEYTGTTLEEMQGWGWQKVHHPDYVDSVTEEWSTKIIEGEPFDNIFPLKGKDGNYRWFLTRITPIKDEQGTVQRWFGTNTDITEQKDIEDHLQTTMVKLKQSNIELEQYAYITSHDLREPLRMITSFLQLLERRYGDQLDEDANEFIGFAVDGAKRLDAMTNDLLEYSKITNEKREIKPVNFENVLEKALTNLKVQIEENNAIIDHDHLPTINGDEELKVHLFQNLISNSIKYRSQETPKIHISATKEKNHYLFSIEDNGIGMSSKHLEKIFTIFQRLHTHDEYEGTGIGLAIAKKIVHQKGGQIWVESELGKGTTFYFTIPIK